MKRGGRATRTKGPDGENIIRVEGRLTNTAVPRFDGGGCWLQYLQICQAIMKSNGWTDKTATVCALGGGSPECCLTNAGGRAGKLGVPLTGPFGLLQLPGETGSIPVAVRERYSPTGYGPSNVCHRTGNPNSTGIRRHGQTRPELDDQGHLYRGSTELWLA